MSAKGKTSKRKTAPPQDGSLKKGDTAGRSPTKAGCSPTNTMSAKGNKLTESDACHTPVWRGTTSSSVEGPSKKQRPEQRKDEGSPDGHPERAFFDSSVKEAASSDSEDADDVGVGTDCPHCMKEDNPHSPRMWEKYADSVGICEVSEATVSLVFDSFSRTLCESVSPVPSYRWAHTAQSSVDSLAFHACCNTGPPESLRRLHHSELHRRRRRRVQKG